MVKQLESRSHPTFSDLDPKLFAKVTNVSAFIM